jgi:rod shape-determining protein MreB and related proteins
MRFRSSVAIDLGTVNTLVWVAGRGIVIEEPTAIAIDTSVGKVAAVGEAADALADKEPQDIEVVHPLRDGVVADLDATAAMLHAFLRRIHRFGVLRPNALVCVPGGATPVERRSIVAALNVRRPRYRVRLIDEPVAAAAGAGFDLTGGAGGFVVDIGGGTTEVAAVAGWRVVRAQSLRKAGNAMDEAIVAAARTELGLIISQRAARHLKMTLGVTGGPEGWAEVVGLDIAHRNPRSENVPGWIIASALDPVVSAIAATVSDLLSDIPAGLAEDVLRGKIRLAGGGALLPGLAARIETVAGVGTVVVDDPLRCVVRGAAEILERGPQARHAAGPGPRELFLVPHSSGCRAILAGSRPASSQPAAVAMSGRPASRSSRFQTGTWPSSPRPSRWLPNE